MYREITYTETRVLKRFKRFILGKCQCRCGEDIEIRNTRGFLKKFQIHHNILRNQSRENNFMWNGGVQHVKGYKKIKKRDHIKHDCQGYVFEHRLVYEDFYKCCLLDWVDIHHIDENPSNNNIENLQPLYHNQHRSKHRKDMSDRICLNCDSNATYIHKDGRQNWIKYKNGYICRKCYHKIIYKNRNKKKG